MKLKPVFNILILTLFVSACSDARKTEEKQTATVDSVVVENVDSIKPGGLENIAEVDENSLLGFYVGNFTAEKVDAKKSPMYLNKINMSIDSIKDGRIIGHSVVAGNKRPFNGTFTKEPGKYVATVKEPGDDKYDGAFSFTLFTNDKKLVGSWAANNPKLAVSLRSYTLSKRTFEYDPKQELIIETRTPVYNAADGESYEGEFITEDAGKINASTTPLATSDVENMYKRDLEIMRNAIYARHGYSFKNRDMRYFFDSEVTWYIPVSTNVTKELTSLEKTNIEMIKRYEDHANTYYDSFGR